MNFRKLLISGVLSASIMIGSAAGIYAGTYTVQKGDTYWSISQKYGISMQTLMTANNATASSVLYVGQNITIPQNTLYTVQKGDTYWLISQKFGVSFTELLKLNGATTSSALIIGQQIKIPAPVAKTTTTTTATTTTNTAGTTTVTAPATTAPAPTAPTATSTQPYITYHQYTVQKGDNLWSIANKFGLPLNDLLKANNMTQSTVLNLGQVIKIPVYNIPIKPTPGPQYGEALDWWTEAQYVVPVGADFQVVDFYTGKTFNVRRTTGANHADAETLTAADTAVMKEIWGGSFSWTSRPVLIKINGRQIAASMSSLPHAGNDSTPGGLWTSWRSDNYGAGPNFDWVKGNGIDGHFDIHFLNSTTHKDGTVNAGHQANVKTAAGIK